MSGVIEAHEENMRQTVARLRAAVIERALPCDAETPCDAREAQLMYDINALLYDYRRMQELIQAADAF